MLGCRCSNNQGCLVWLALSELPPDLTTAPSHPPVPAAAPPSPSLSPESSGVCDSSGSQSLGNNSHSVDGAETEEDASKEEYEEDVLDGDGAVAFEPGQPQDISLGGVSF